MTNGSNNPLGVVKAAYFSCPSKIQTLLYPHRISILVNILPFVRTSIRSSIRGSGNWSFTVYLLIFL